MSNKTLTQIHEEFKERSGLNKFNVDITKGVIQNYASVESIGYIHSILQVDKHVYAIIMRADSPDFDISCADGLDGASFFNCVGDFHSKSPYELLIPITNIDLSIDIIDPRTLIGGSVLVSELFGEAVKAEYIGELERTDQLPIKISKKVFNSIRNYVGAYTRLDSDEKSVQDVLNRFGIDQELSKKLYETDIHDWAGNVIRFENEAVYTNDVMQPKDGEIIIKPIEDLQRHIHEKGMKTKNCHLPVKIFSAR